MFKRFLVMSVFVGVCLWVAPALAQPVPFTDINVKKAQLVFLRNVVLVDISGCFVLGEGSNGIDPTAGENPALHFVLAGTDFALTKNIQTASFKAIIGNDGVTIVGYTTGPTFGSEGDTPGLVRVRLREVQGPARSKSPDPCKQKGNFWRFEIKGSVSQASRQFRQIFELTIGDHTSGEMDIQVAVRLRRAARGTSSVPRSVQSLEIFDLQGRRVTSDRSLQGLTAPSLSSLPTGVYLIVITEQGPDGQTWRRVHKVVIHH